MAECPNLSLPCLFLALWHQMLRSSIYADVAFLMFSVWDNTALTMDFLSRVPSTLSSNHNLVRQKHHIWPLLSAITQFTCLNISTCIIHVNVEIKFLVIHYGPHLQFVLLYDGHQIFSHHKMAYSSMGFCCLSISALKSGSNQYNFF